jgi:hypothetical protein
VKLVAGDRPVAPSAWDELLLDRDGWDGLLRAVRNEVAMVLPRLPHQQMPAVPPSAKHDPKVSRVKGDASVLGQQTRTRLRRLEILRLLPTRTNKDIVASLDGFGQGGPDDSTVSKDITAMRSAGAIHATRLDRTTKGDEVLRMHST